MSFLEVIEKLNVGGAVALLVVIGGLIEISPIKVSPLQWIGRRLNKETFNKVGMIEKKLDEHIAQSLRTKILSFQDDIILGQNKTKEQWKEVVNAIYAYEKYCEENKINNGLCKEASQLLLTTYQQKLISNTF